MEHPEGCQRAEDDTPVSPLPAGPPAGGMLALPWEPRESLVLAHTFGVGGTQAPPGGGCLQRGTSEAHLEVSHDQTLQLPSGEVAPGLPSAEVCTSGVSPTPLQALPAGPRFPQ